MELASSSGNERRQPHAQHSEGLVHGRYFTQLASVPAAKLEHILGALELMLAMTDSTSD